MPRTFYRDTVAVRGPAGMVPLAGASVAFYEPDGGTLTPIAFPLYPNETDPAPLALPYLTGALGELEVWADAPHRVRVVVSKSGLNHADEFIDLEPSPGTMATIPDVENALALHVGAPDPHAQYLSKLDASLTYLPLAHEPGTNPHPQYLTQSAADGRYVLATAPTIDSELRLYIQRIMAVLDPGGPPPPP